MNRKKAALAAVMIFALMGLLSAWNKEAKTIEGVSGSAEETKKSVVVQVITPETGMNMASTAYKATLEPAQEAIVCSQAGGKVIQILFENGKPTTQGEPLVMLDDRNARTQLQVAEGQLASAKAGLQKVEASLANTRTTFSRTQVLYQQGAVSKGEFDSAESALKMLEADAASARAGVQSAKGNVEACRIALDNMIIRAPISGIMDGKTVSLGQQITPDTKLGMIKEITSIDAVFEVDQTAIEWIRMGSPAHVKLKKDEEQSIKGTISSVDLSANSSSRVFQAKVRLQNPDGVLRPGVMAWVSLEKTGSVQVLTLPVEAVIGKEGAYGVFVIDKDVAVRKTVVLGEVIGNRVEIKSGISAESQVIVTNLNNLQDGDAVTVVTE